MCGEGAFCTAASLWQMALRYLSGRWGWGAGGGEREAGDGGGWWGCEVVERAAGDNPGCSGWRSVGSERLWGRVGRGPWVRGSWVGGCGW